MRKKWWPLLQSIVLLFLMVPVQNSSAISDNLVISEVQTGGATAAQEFVEIFNNSATTVNVTNWKLTYYSSSSDLSTPTQTFATFSGAIAPHSYVLLVSSVYILPSGVIQDGTFTGGMSSTGGHLRILDSNGIEKDKFGWGTAINPEGVASSAPPSSSSANRKVDQNGLVDTDNNSQDFITTSPSPQGGGLAPVDVCPNLDGNQLDLPVGYEISVTGDCVVIPVDIDECPNLDGDQLTVPVGYQKNLEGGCVLEDAEEPEPKIYLPVTVSELLPNPASPKTDDEDEFIELYNPNNQSINLEGYKLQSGSSFNYSYSLPNIAIPENSYLALYSSNTKLILSNSGSAAKISDPNGVEFHSSEPYQAIGEDESWALIDGEWVVTDRVTPNAPNLSPTEFFVETGGKGGLEPCPIGKYRNPLTNRCKNIETASTLKPCSSNQYRSPETNRCRKKEEASVLKACAVDQYRNPETNRCRNIASSSSSLRPCNPDQYRNPQTNRCKKIEALSNLKACEEGQERNPETNRCRKIAGVTSGGLDSVATAAGNPVSYPALAIVGAGLIGYALYEYRIEISKLFSRIKNNS